jgi:hypothetical protein
MRITTGSDIVMDGLVEDKIRASSGRTKEMTSKALPSSLGAREAGVSKDGQGRNPFDSPRRHPSRRRLRRLLRMRIRDDPNP